MSDLKKNNGFQAVLIRLCEFWEKHGCILIPPTQTEISVPLFHQNSFFGMASDKKFSTMYLQSHVASREFKDIKNNIQNYNFLNFQVLLKDKIEMPQQLFLESLSYLGFELKDNDILFKNESFENFIFRINADGYRVYLNGNSIAKIHYIQNIGNFICDTVPIAIIYDLDKILMLLQNVTNLWDVSFSGISNDSKVLYGDLMFMTEKQNYDFVLDETNNNILFNEFENFKDLASNLLDKKIVIPAYTAILKAKYYLDILNLRGFILHNDKISYNKILRNLVDRCCEEYILINKKSE